MFKHSVDQIIGGKEMRRPFGNAKTYSFGDVDRGRHDDLGARRHRCHHLHKPKNAAKRQQLKADIRPGAQIQGSRHVAGMADDG